MEDGLEGTGGGDLCLSGNLDSPISLDWEMAIEALQLRICQWKTVTLNGILTILELENAIWEKIGLGYKIYTPLTGPS